MFIREIDKDELKRLAKEFIENGDEADKLNEDGNYMDALDYESAQRDIAMELASYAIEYLVDGVSLSDMYYKGYKIDVFEDMLSEDEIRRGVSTYTVQIIEDDEVLDFDSGYMCTDSAIESAKGMIDGYR